MKKSIAIAVGTVALLFAAGTPLAQNAMAPAASPGAAAMQSGASMNMGSHMGQMDERMKKMQALHERMMSATTPEERQKVMDEQQKEMQASMAMMNPMMQGGAMMGGAGTGMMGQKGKAADANAQMQMMQVMQKRMDMMQMMMQSMMDQQGMMAGPRNVDAVPKM